MATRGWLNKRNAGALLADLAPTLVSASLRVALFDSDGRLLAAEPGNARECNWEAVVTQACRTQQQVIAGQSVALPLIVHGEPAGVLAAHAVEGHTANAVATLHAIRVPLIRLAEAELEKRTLAQETLDRYREINLLYRIGETIGAAVDLEEVTHLILQESMNTVKVRKGLVMLRDETAGDLVVRACQGADMSEGERWPLAQGVLGATGREGNPVIVNDTGGDPRTYSEARICSSLLCVPLKTRDRLLGVLALGDKAAPDPRSSRLSMGESGGQTAMFTASDQNLLMALASQAAVAIDTALEVQAREERLRQQIRDLRIAIDHVKKARQVAEITESEYFQRLRAEARRLRDQAQQER